MNDSEELHRSPDAPPAPTTGWSLVHQWREDRGWLLTLLFFFAMGALLVAIQSTALPASIAATRGHGLPGTATATNVDCSGSGGACIYSGDYASADGTISFHHVDFHGGQWPIHKPVAALYEGQSRLGAPEIFQTDNHQTWLWEMFSLAFGCGLMLLASLLYVLRVRGVVK